MNTYVYVEKNSFFVDYFLSFVQSWLAHVYDDSTQLSQEVFPLCREYSFNETED